MSPKEIGQILKASRVRAGMSIIDVSKELGVTRQTLYRWETGKDMPRVHMYFRLVELYDMEDAPTIPTEHAQVV